MSSIDPLITVHIETAAFRKITPDLLAETYLAPRVKCLDLTDALSSDALSIVEYPWSSSFAVAPNETVTAVQFALRSLAMATQSLSPDEIDITGLDADSRLCRHIVALSDLWRRVPAVLPENLQLYAHILRSSAEDALERLPLVTADPCRFATTVEKQLHAQLLTHHGLADPSFSPDFPDGAAFS